MIERVISGGQTGADQAGWRAAKAAGIETGGYMPLDWMTESGSRPEFMTEFGAEEWPELFLTLAEQYRQRTKANVRKSDVTIWFGDPQSPGGRLTTKTAISLSRPLAIIGGPDRDFTPGYTAGWLTGNGAKVVNVAGNRESSAPGIGKWVEEYLAEVFRLLRDPLAP